MRKNQSVVLLASIVLSFLSPLFADDNQSANPENYIGKDRSINIAKGREYMAVTSDPMATQAANDVLAKDGTAADAAIAAQLVLGLTEPQSSGLGGGALHYIMMQQPKHCYLLMDVKLLQNLLARDTF